MEGRIPASYNIKRWDGAAKACAAWDNLRRVTFDLAFPHPRKSTNMENRIPSYGIKMAIAMYIFTGRRSHGEGLLSRSLYQPSWKPTVTLS